MPNPDPDPDQDKLAKEQANHTFEQKIKELQERVRKMGVASDGSDDKAFMDEAWGEES